MDKFKLKSRRKRVPDEKQAPTSAKPPEAKVAKPTLEVAQQQQQPDASADFLMAARAGNIDKLLNLLDQVDINSCNVNGLNALHLASKEGHFVIVSELLSRGANINAATNKGNTALHIASLAGHDNIVRLLVQHRAVINVQSQTGFTPLYMAAQENHVDIVKFLLQSGASQTLATQEGFTPMDVATQQGHDKIISALSNYDSLRRRGQLPALHAAVKRDDVAAASLLLQGDNDIDAPSSSGFTPLHIACHYGNLNAARFLVESKADVNYHKTRNAIAPLHIASKWGHIEMVELILNNGGDINCKTRDGLMPLHCAARSGQDLVVDILLKRGASVTAKTKNGLEPLHMAVQGDHTTCVQLLLQHGAPIENVTMDYLTSLHVGAHCGNVRSVQVLLDNNCDVDSRALNGFTPLHVACKKRRIAVVELLMKYRAAIEATTESGLTPLHVASFMGDANIVRRLLANGALLNAVTVRGETPLHLAARSGETEVIRMLLQKGAAIEAKSKDDSTPLHVAARLGHVETVMLLLENGAQPDALTSDKYTPLHIAAKDGQLVVAQALLEHGADQSLKTKKGFTPLHVCAKYDHPDIAQILLAHKGSNPDAIARNGLTPLHVASHYGHSDVARVLIKHHADPNMAAKNGYTPLHIAARRNQLGIAELLLNDKTTNSNSESKNGYTPLHLASQEGHLDMVHLLLEHGSKVDYAAFNGLCPLHLVAENDHLPVAEELVIEAHGTIDPRTKAGYTPLHTACHFGRPTMIKFLLQHGAEVNAKTSDGYTPLHQAAQQGHVLVIRALLQANGSPNALTNAGQTPLSIAEQLGNVSCMELLKPLTEVDSLLPSVQEERVKYLAVLPETMHESVGYDSDEESGKDLFSPSPRASSRQPHDQLQYIPTTMKDTTGAELHMDDHDVFVPSDDSAMPLKQRRRDLLFPDNSQSERYSTISSTGMQAINEELQYMNDEGDLHLSYATLTQEDEEKEHQKSATPSYISPPSEDQRFATLPSSFKRVPYTPDQSSRMSDLGSARLSASEPDSRLFESSSYTGMLSETSCSYDNMTLDRSPIHSGFLVSFMVDARGGAKRGWRHSGMRIIVPPTRANQPTRITCKLIKSEKLEHPPPLMDGEALATRILKMGPPGAKFEGHVIIEIPHYASMRGHERDITIMRSEDGIKWREHTTSSTEQDIISAFGSSFEGEVLETAEELYHQRVTRILTTDFPAYFAIVTTVRAESCVVGPEGAVLNSTVIPSIRAVVPPGALNKKIRLSLRVQPVTDDLARRFLGDTASVGPVISFEPRRRKFHRSINVTLPLPPKTVATRQANQGVRYVTEVPTTLRLLCSLTEGTALAKWEDITDSTPLTVHDNSVSFNTTVSGRFWLIDSADVNLVPQLSGDLYKELIVVPFMSKFVIFAKRRSPRKGQLRVFCTTDDKLVKTLEQQEHFIEVARSRDIEVLNGKPQYLEMSGNLLPISKSSSRTDPTLSSTQEKQLQVVFHPFTTNRLAYPVRIQDSSRDPTGQIKFAPNPLPPPSQDGVSKGSGQHTCNLSITLPEYVFKKSSSNLNLDASDAWTAEHEQASQDLNIPLMTEMLKTDWIALARHIGVREKDIISAQVAHEEEKDQAKSILCQLIQTKGRDDARNRLEPSLRRIGRIDIVRRCLYSTSTDEEWAEIARRRESVVKPEDWKTHEEEFSGDDNLDMSDDELAKPLKRKFQNSNNTVARSRQRPSGDVSQDSLSGYPVYRAQDAQPDLAVSLEYVTSDLSAHGDNVISKKRDEIAIQQGKQKSPFSKEDITSSQDIDDSFVIIDPADSDLQDIKSQLDAVSLDRLQKHVGDFGQLSQNIDASGIAHTTEDASVELRTDTREEEEIKEDGTKVKRIITTIRHFHVTKGVEDGESGTRPGKKLLGTEVNESILELAPGISEDSENLSKINSEQLSEVLLPDGTWLRNRILLCTVQRILVSGQMTEVVGKSIPVGFTKISQPLPEGEIDTKLPTAQKSVKEENFIKPDGTRVKKIITETRHIIVKEVTDSSQSHSIPISKKDSEVLVGVEIYEDVIEIAPGISDSEINLHPAKITKKKKVPTATLR